MAIKIESQNAEYFKLKGNIYYIEKNWEKAQEYYKKSLKLDPSLSAPYYKLGLVYCSLENFKKAIGFLENYVKKSEKCE